MADAKKPVQERARMMQLEISITEAKLLLNGRQLIFNLKNGYKIKLLVDPDELQDNHYDAILRSVGNGPAH